jgi:hypothetical protein
MLWLGKNNNQSRQVQNILNIILKLLEFFTDQGAIMLFFLLPLGNFGSMPSFEDFQSDSNLATEVISSWIKSLLVNSSEKIDHS